MSKSLEKRVLHCPFCGSNDVKVQFDNSGHVHYVVRCLSCFAQSSKSYANFWDSESEVDAESALATAEQYAIASWNKRAS